MTENERFILTKYLWSTPRHSYCRTIRNVLLKNWLNEIKVSNLNAENGDDECNEMSNSEKSKIEWQIIIVV